MSHDIWLEKAVQSLRTAEANLAACDSDAACNRAYYAMYYAARAALIAADFQQLAMAKTHSGLISAFNEKMIKTGLIAKNYGRNLGIESNRRLVSDYEGVQLSADEAALAIANATEFVGALKTWVTNSST
jgi:uncharacterized protein (UPF0332 family)